MLDPKDKFALLEYVSRLLRTPPPLDASKTELKESPSLPAYTSSSIKMPFSEGRSIPSQTVNRERMIQIPDYLEPCPSVQKSSQDLQEYISQNMQESFSERLLHLIDTKGLKDNEVYHRAMIDRRLFSKIRSDRNYHPSKNTAIALGLALHLTCEEMEALLAAAGYTLSDSNQSDLTIQFCVERKIYQLMDVNEALDYLGLAPL